MMMMMMMRCGVVVVQGHLAGLMAGWGIRHLSPEVVDLLTRMLVVSQQASPPDQT